ncbi:MAG: restriction endonuclease subunit S, partial [Chloroflexota bacterium]|nr:restriction endonuclease subunit S [Chloroflexota bacterium]
MMSESWDTLSIKNICTRIVSGGTPSTRKDSYYGGKIPWLRTQEINFNRIYDTDVKITEEGLNNSSAKMIPEKSVIMAMYGATAGKVAINEISLATNQACCNLIINQAVADYRYVYYQLCLKYEEIANLSIGAAQQNLNVGTISNLPIHLPPLTTQKRIADILGTLDDKIELNRQMNRTLEAMARAIFKSWFVDFDPVTSKMEGRDYPLPAEVLDLYPDKLVESEL